MQNYHSAKSKQDIATTLSDAKRFVILNITTNRLKDYNNHTTCIEF